MKVNVLYTLIFLLFAMAMNLNAQKVVKLWSGDPPSDNKLHGTQRGEWNDGWVENVSEPELFIYQPEKTMNTRMAVVIFPGGGYAGLAMKHEGHDFAIWLKDRGITAVVVKYRMPNKYSDIVLSDGWQAMRYVRSKAEELDIDADKIGVAGFSAGGHLASTISTQYAQKGISTRPDFSILFYPVITMGDYTHQGSRQNLLGNNPALLDIHRFSNETQVTVNTPPAILLLSDDDKAVPPANSIGYYNALKKNDIPSSMYIFPEGGHGWGMNTDFKYHKQVLSLLGEWLDDINNREL